MKELSINLSDKDLSDAISVALTKRVERALSFSSRNDEIQDTVNKAVSSVCPDVSRVAKSVALDFIDSTEFHELVREKVKSSLEQAVSQEFKNMFDGTLRAIAKSKAKEVVDASKL